MSALYYATACPLDKCMNERNISIFRRDERRGTSVDEHFRRTSIVA
jgi:hypothetical protein